MHIVTVVQYTINYVDFASNRSDKPKNVGNIIT